MRSLDAKVSVGGSSGFWGGLAASVEVDGRGAKGLVDVGICWEDMEKGFAFVMLDFGLVAPNRVAPKSVGCCCASGFSGRSCSGAGEPCSVRYFLFSLKTRMLPGLRPHCVFRQVKICSLLSSLGKYSGRSPLSCKSSDMGLLQTLHLENEADGVVVESNHIYLYC